MRIIQSLFTYIFIVSAIIAAAFCGACIAIYHTWRIDFNMLSTYNTGLPSILLDDTGNEWGRFQRDWRKPTTLDKLPAHLINAFIAAEDWAFFSHHGISIKGIVRSTIVNLYHGRRAQGASTITQQLVKLLFFDNAKTFTRKIKEQFLALIVEQHYTKEQILEAYLNYVYFGCGIYGVEAAAQRFWAKSAQDVTLDEAAVLAAIMRSPARYSPITHPLSSKKRRNSVLTSMHKLGFIDDKDYSAAQQKPIALITQKQVRCAPHAQEYIRVFLEDLFGKTLLYTGGLTIQTTLNKKIQYCADHAFHEHCSTLKKTIHPSIDGGLVTLDVATGAIKALVGGYDFKASKFNRALQARRQIGSTFKPLVYACALDKGMRFSDTALDEPFELAQQSGIWRPGNVYDTFEGQMTLARALSYSNNIIAIKTLLKTGYQPVIAMARRCGISAPLHPFPSLALGCVDTSVKEVAGMFNVFANQGMYVEPHILLWVKDAWGTKIWRHTHKRTQAMVPSISSQVAKILEIGINRIKAYIKGPWIESAIISKTGTTNDWRTCWFVGSTPDYTTALYIGRDDNKPLGVKVFPTKTALPIWLELHRSLPIKTKEFVRDPSLHSIFIDECTGKEVAPETPSALPILALRS